MAVTNPQFWMVVRDASHPCHSKEAEAERQRFFEMIRPTGECWKGPICAVIDAADFDDCNEAAIWFTGAGLDVIDHIGTEVVVSGPGYYATIGA